MIQPLPDFTATPIAPASGIAPKELVGHVNFPQVLGGIQAGSAKKLVGSAQPDEGDDTGAGATPSNLFAPLEVPSVVTGKAFPPTGMGLPTRVQGNELPVVQQTRRESRPSIPQVSANRADLGQVRLGRVETDLVRPLTTPAGFPEPEVELPLDGARSVSDDERLLPPHLTVAARETPGALADALQPVQVSLAPRSKPDLLNNGALVVARDPALPAKIKPGIRPQNEQGQATPVPESPRGQETIRQLEAAGTSFAISRDSFDDGAERTASKLTGPTMDRVRTENSRPREAAIPQSASAEPQAESQVFAKPEIGEATDMPTKPAAAQLAAFGIQASRTAKADVPLAKPALRSDQRVPAKLAAKHTASVSRESIARVRPYAAPSPAIALGATPSDVDATRTQPPAGFAILSSHSAQTPVEVTAPQSFVAQPQAAAAPITPQPNNLAPVTVANSAFHLSAQLESTIDQLTETRSAAQSNRPELTVRHQEFGAITMRLDATGSDLRATLSARDPGFVPAIQTALAERSVAASGDTAGTAQKGHDQHGSQSNAQSGSQSGAFAGSHPGSQGQGWNSQGAYGSSTGAGQGTSQPYTGQTHSQDEDSVSDRGGRMGRGDGPGGESELFA